MRCMMFSISESNKNCTKHCEHVCLNKGNQYFHAIHEDAEKYNLVTKITKDAPPVFIAATAEDMLTNYGALPVAQKYAQLGLWILETREQAAQAALLGADVIETTGSVKPSDCN